MPAVELRTEYTVRHECLSVAGLHAQADGVADYYAAETLLIQETFQRQLGCQVSLLSALRVRGCSSAWLAPAMPPS